MELFLDRKMTELSWLSTPDFVVAAFSISPDHDHERAICRRGNDVNCHRTRSRNEDGSGRQPRGVPAQMIAHEGRDEIIAVVVAFLASEQERDVRLCAGLLQ